MKRMWINQPSTLQTYHKYHGKNVLFDEKQMRVYFTKGPVISMEINKLSLSEGWINGQNK